jgi:hypothetical protein
MVVPVLPELSEKPKIGPVVPQTRTVTIAMPKAQLRSLP